MTRHNGLLAGLLALGLINFTSFAEDSDKSLSHELAAKIDGLFEAYTVGDRPGYAIGVIKNGSLVFARGYGKAAIQSGQDIGADTSFNLASLSKQFTGGVIALDALQGSLKLDDSIRKHWPAGETITDGLALPVLPDFADKITVGHLVYMTSGLPEYYSLPSPKGGWLSEDRFTVHDAVTTVFHVGELSYPPGTRWSYSNINYQLLALISAGKQVQSFKDHMHERIFAPLGMRHSWVDAPIEAERPGRAISYVWENREREWQEAPRLSPHYGGSGVFSSLKDLAKWDRALYGDEETSPFPKGFGRLMLSTRKYEHDKTNDAFGLVHGRYQGLETVWYEGGDYGVSTYMVRIPGRDETLICLANFANAGCRSKTEAVLDILLAFDP